MATLKRGDNVYFLGGEQEFGRAERCALRLHTPLASSLHASLRWREQWELRDLGSAHGTFVNDKRIAQGWVPLAAGDRLAFADPSEVFVLENASPPGPLLFPTEGGPPLDAHSLALVLRRSDGTWLCDDDGVEITLGEHSDLTVGERRYRFSIAHLRTTIPTERVERQASLHDFAVTLSVSKDEEYVQVRVHNETAEHVLPSRAFHYLLLTLARLKSEDIARGLSEASAGWVHVEDLAAMLKCSARTLNVDIFRLREQFAALPMCDGEQIVERRARTGQVRTGASRLFVVRL